MIHISCDFDLTESAGAKLAQPEIGRDPFVRSVFLSFRYWHPTKHLRPTGS